jgi:hypothetical protein
MTGGHAAKLWQGRRALAAAFHTKLCAYSSAPVIGAPFEWLLVHILSMRVSTENQILQ